jgi:hypothetical protein
MSSIEIMVHWVPGQERQEGVMLASIAEVLRDMNLMSRIGQDIFVRSKEEHDEDAAAADRIFGVPSIRINRVDIEHMLVMYDKPGLWKRKYMFSGREILAPTTGTIREAIINALARQRAC